MRRRSDRPDSGGLVRAAALAPVLALFLALSGCSGNAVSHGAEDQLDFGVSMARQGLWSEALFRFEKARAADPGNPRILNNIAVALEAAGRYEEAMEAYREAIRLAPGNRDLEANYARFVDFYQSFQADQVPEVLTGDSAPAEDSR